MLSKFLQSHSLSTCTVLDGHGSCAALLLYNLAFSAVKVGDVITVVDPVLRNIKFTGAGSLVVRVHYTQGLTCKEPITFSALSIDHTRVQINGSKPSESQMAPTVADMHPV